MIRDRTKIPSRAVPISISKRIKNIFKYSYYDRPEAIYNASRNGNEFSNRDLELSINEREYYNFMVNEIGSDNPTERQKEEFFGRYFANPIAFRFMPGERAAIEEIIETVKVVKNKSKICQRRFWGFEPSYPAQDHPLNNPLLEKEFCKIELIIKRIKQEFIELIKAMSNLYWMLRMRWLLSHALCANKIL